MVAIYVRQSVDKKDSISIESQIDFCRKKLLDDEAFYVYTDRGYSGKNTQRPQFTQMLNDIKDGKVTKVLVYKVDRISRAIVDFSNMMEVFNKYKVEFVSATQPIDTTNPMGKAMLSVVMIFAQLERETIQQRIKDNYYERGSKGFYLGGRPPFGYDKIEIQYKGKKTYKFKKNNFSQVIFDLYEKYANTNSSLGDLVFELSNKGQKTSLGNNWSTATLGRTLRNPVYVMANADVYMYLINKGAAMNNSVEEYIGQNGCYLYGEREKSTRFSDLTGCFVTIGLHTGIIPAELWLKCQNKLSKNKQLKNSGKGTHSWLSGLMKCGYCGYAINVVTNNSGACYINCGGRKLKVCNKRKKIIRISDIEYCVEKVLLSAIKSIGSIKIYEESHNNSSEIHKLKSESIQISENIEKILNKIQDCEEITAEYLNSRIYKLDEQLKNINQEISTLSSYEKEKGTVDLYESIKDWNRYTLEGKKQIAKIFIEKINITDDEIVVDFY